jgi:hypothetical protein
MSQARDFADSFSAVSTGRRNMVINGAMQVAQRGTSGSGKTAAGYFAADRYNSAINTAGTWTVSQDTSAPDGFKYSQKFECTTADSSLAAGDYVIHQTRLEGQDLQQFKFGTSSAEAMTISFWVKSSKTGTYTCEVMHITTGGAYPAAGKTYSISSADTWEYKTITLDGDTANDIRNTSTIGIYLNLWLAVGSNFSSGTFNDGSWTTTTADRIHSSNVNLADTVGNTWQITGIQLEVGNSASPFEHRSYGEELALCQRYYHVGKGYEGLESDELSGTIHFPTTMRVAPTTTTTVTETNGGFTALTGLNTSVDHIGWWIANTAASKYAKISLTCDSEL